MDLKQLYIERCDLRAEVLASELLDTGILLDNIQIRPMGAYKRAYSKDILKAEFFEGDSAAESELQIEVNREGIYDMLPEGLFHQPDKSFANFTAAEVVESINKTRKEESEARKFFEAVEKELYRSRIRIEYSEKRGIDGLSAGSSNFSARFEKELYLKLWPDLHGLEPEYRSVLFQVLPRVHSIVGDFELTQYIFSHVLAEKVIFDLNLQRWYKADSQGLSELGDCFLGYDSFINNFCYSDAPHLTISVGPLENHEWIDFDNNGKALKALEILMKYLLPAEVDVSVLPILPKGSDQLVLQSDNFGSSLGYTSRI
jgi:hypothetical protein